MQHVLIVMLVALLGASCAAASAPADQATVAIVRDYVLRHRHWHPRDFDIRRERDEGKYRVYIVVNHDDEKRHFQNGREVFETGGGKSFMVYYDPRESAVVKEMHFQ